MPLYFMKPRAANGAAQSTHTHDTVSVPSASFKRKYTAAAAAQAITEKTSCLKARKIRFPYNPVFPYLFLLPPLTPFRFLFGFRLDFSYIASV